MKQSPFFRQAQLMLRAMPIVAREACFALKGGTAINFFVQRMPRLSVDIDLVYLPLEEREKALLGIGAALDRIAQELSRTFPGSQVHRLLRPDRAETAKLVLRHNQQQVKIEPNQVIRGTVYPVERRPLVPEAQELFEMAVEIPVVSLADLYAGKLCAALDRQHPRDVFDVMLLLRGEGITDEIRRAFVVYLLCHHRTMHELLQPSLKDLKRIFEQEFVGMTAVPVGLEDLMSARQELIGLIRSGFTTTEREFLLSFKRGEPDWSLAPFPNLHALPAVRWKLDNIRLIPKKRHAELVRKLENALGGGQ